MVLARTVIPNALGANFAAFFKRLDPSPTYVSVASRAQARIRALVEDREGPAGDLRVGCFIQGSYGRRTAIHTINDVDIVALCGVPWSENANRSTRDQVFTLIREAIASDGTYADKTRCGADSICVKVELAAMKLEVLPALHAPGKGFNYEPFYMFRPGEDRHPMGWVRAFGKYHQKRLSEKNGATGGSFIPMVKVLKHIRWNTPSLSDADAASFHLECLLYAIQDSVYCASVPETIEGVLRAIAGLTPEKVLSSGVLTPCKDQQLFSPTEWSESAYVRFHGETVRWYGLAARANASADRDEAVHVWQELLGDTYFPKEPAN